MLFRSAVRVEMARGEEARALGGGAVGHLKTFKSIPLFTVEETMEALRNAGDVALRGPERWEPEW
jgi:hypothetical protein